MNSKVAFKVKVFLVKIGFESVHVKCVILRTLLTLQKQFCYKLGASFCPDQTYLPRVLQKFVFCPCAATLRCEENLLFHSRYQQTIASDDDLRATPGKYLQG